jgi:hypothetical protein
VVHSPQLEKMIFGLFHTNCLNSTASKQSELTLPKHARRSVLSSGELSTFEELRVNGRTRSEKSKTEREESWALDEGHREYKREERRQS